MAEEQHSGFLADSQRVSSRRTFRMGRALAVPLIILGAALAVYFGLLWYSSRIESSISGVEAQIEQLDAKRDKEAESKVSTLHSQLKLAGILVQNHIIWSRALEELQSFIQPRVQIESLNADFEDGTFEFSAKADGYSTVAKQVASFYSNASIEDVAISGISSEDGGVSFDMVLTFDSNKLLLKANE